MLWCQNTIDTKAPVAAGLTKILQHTLEILRYQPGRVNWIDKDDPFHKKFLTS